jgi:hypothetical protein
MDKGLIISDYRLAKHPAKQVEILAQVNGCAPGDIVAVLKEAGVYKQGRARKKADQSNRNRWDKEMALALYRLGLGDGQIARELGVTRASVFGLRKKHGLEANVREKERGHE